MSGGRVKVAAILVAVALYSVVIGVIVSDMLNMFLFQAQPLCLVMRCDSKNRNCECIERIGDVDAGQVKTHR